MNHIGPQTKLHLENFKISDETMPLEVIYAYARIKKAAAEINDLVPEKKEAIIKACDEILEGKWNDQFPVKVWQTGSGTHTNMNVNEAIASRASEICDMEVHPNDDVNMSQSSNDTFPSAMYMAGTTALSEKLLPALQQLMERFQKKAEKYQDVIKIGRTHLMDAVPIRFGQELDAYVQLLGNSEKKITQALEDLAPLPLGGTAVGSGLSAPEGFAKNVIAKLGAPFVAMENPAAGLSSHDAMISASGAMEHLACNLIKIAQDIRLLASGPRCGLAEIKIPANEPGSSIMPGKVNPTQAEALLMVCVQVKGLHRAIVEANSLGELQLNVGKPVMIYNLLKQVQLLSDAMISFEKNCIAGMEPDVERMKQNLDNSLMLVTALNKHIGYDKAAQIAKDAYGNGRTLKESAVALGLLTEEEFEEYVKAEEMV